MLGVCDVRGQSTIVILVQMSQLLNQLDFFVIIGAYKGTIIFAMVL